MVLNFFFNRSTVVSGLSSHVTNHSPQFFFFFFGLKNKDQSYSVRILLSRGSSVEKEKCRSSRVFWQIIQWGFTWQTIKDVFFFFCWAGLLFTYLVRRFLNFYLFIYLFLFIIWYFIYHYKLLCQLIICIIVTLIY